MNQLLDRALTPADRVRPGASGTAAAATGGHSWLLAGHLPDLGPVWGRLYDQNHLARSYDLPDLRLAAWKLLAVNYTLAPDEAVALVRSFAPGDLVAAVECALFGPERVHRTYPQWVSSALLSNGIDPESVPAAMLRDVLDQLVMTGRAVPAHKFVSSAEAAAVLRGLS